MKKIVMAVLAAGIMTSGAFADNTISNLAAGELANLKNGTLTLGAGFVNQNVGGAGLMADYKVNDPLVSWDFNGEVGRDYNNATVKVKSNATYNVVYAGAGYFDTKGKDTNGTSTFDINTDSYVTTGGQIHKKAGALLLGVSPEFTLGVIAFNIDAGYKLGDVKGPYAGLSTSEKVGDLVLGSKLELDRVFTTQGNIDRVGIYGTIAF